MLRENDNNIRKELKGKKKVENISIPKFKKHRNHLKRMNLPNSRTWFRFRCKITIFNVDLGADKTQEHLDICEST